MEPKVNEEDNIQDSSSSRHSQPKIRRIKKSPKLHKKTSPPQPQRTETNLTLARPLHQFGVFESEMQKQSRLQKFWLTQIDHYYKNEIGQSEKEMLTNIMEESIPSLQQMLNQQSHVLQSQRVPFEQLFRYVQLVRQCRLGYHLKLVSSPDTHLLAIFDQEGQLQKMIEITQEEEILVRQRQKFMKQLRQREDRYNQDHQEQHHLSEISSQVAFLLYLMRQNKAKINQTLKNVQGRMFSQPSVNVKQAQIIRDNYVTHLIKKNLNLALSNDPIDFLNYFAILDSIQQYGVADPEQKSITDKKQFEEYIKKKKGKKSRKNPKGVLKTACGACLSPHYEQYNPFLYCPDCHVRFHKFCYIPFKDNLCQACFHKKQPMPKGRGSQCQFCSNRGLLSIPLKQVREGYSIHVFCMLINGLWKFQNGQLQFHSNKFVNPNIPDQICTICRSGVCVYPCACCQAKVHPLCAYLSGWLLQIDNNGLLRLQCCQGVDLQKNSYRRKFILNYKKILFKETRDK